MSVAIWKAERDGPAETTWRVERDGRHFRIDVAAAQLDPLAVERTIYETLGLPMPERDAAQRFSIQETAEAHGGLFELEQDTVWTIYDGGRPICRFSGGTSHDYVGGDWSAATGSHGADIVVLSADGRHAIAGDSCRLACYALADFA